MTLREYLSCDDNDVLTEHLTRLDASIMALHNYGFYVVSFDPNNIALYDGELSLSSFNNKIDYINSGINANGPSKDILEMCAIGICAYNKFQTFYYNNEFINYIMDNFDTFTKNEKIPKLMLDYYHSVFVDGNIEYLNNYLFKMENGNNDSKVSNHSYHLSKSTAIGRSFAQPDDKAFISILAIPCIMVALYCAFLIYLMVFK